MPSVTIDTPCPGIDVPLTHTYSGTYDLRQVLPDPKSTVRVEVTLTVTDSNGIHTYGPADATLNNGAWTHQFAGVVAGKGKLTVQLYVDNKPVDPPTVVEDFFTADVLTAGPCGDILPIPVAPPGPAAAGAALVAPAPLAVPAALVAPPGYAYQFFTDVGGPGAHMVARIERRYHNGVKYTRWLSVSVAPAFPLPGRRWWTLILVPTARPASAHDYLIVEFFNAAGTHSAGVYSRKLP